MRCYNHVIFATCTFGQVEIKQDLLNIIHEEISYPYWFFKRWKCPYERYVVFHCVMLVCWIWIWIWITS